MQPVVRLRALGLTSVSLVILNEEQEFGNMERIVLGFEKLARLVQTYVDLLVDQVEATQDVVKLLRD